MALEPPVPSRCQESSHRFPTQLCPRSKTLSHTQGCSSQPLQHPQHRWMGGAGTSPIQSITAHLVYILLLILEEGEFPPIQAVCDFVGANKLLLPHTARALRDDPTQPHLPQQVGLWRGEEDEWGAVRMGYTALAPTRTTKSGWEGGHWDKGRAAHGTGAPLGRKQSIPPSLHPKVGRARGDHQPMSHLPPMDLPPPGTSQDTPGWQLDAAV